MRWTRLLAGAAVTTLAWLHTGEAGALVLDDYLQHGYVVLSQTRVPGTFTGCQRGRRIAMADGTSFLCTKEGMQASFVPRVYVLALPGQMPSVVLIGSRAYTGQLGQLGHRVFRNPISIDDADPSLPAAPHARLQAIPIIGVKRVESVNDLTASDRKRLNDSQADPLPTHLPPVTPFHR